MAHSGGSGIVFCGKAVSNESQYLVVRYLIVGASNTAIYALLVWVFLSFGALPHYFSVGAAFLCAMIFQYFANRRFTFRSSGAQMPEIFRYLIAALINYLLSLIIIDFSLNYVRLPTWMVGVVAAGAAAAFGFFISVLWVYKK